MMLIDPRGKSLNLKINLMMEATFTNRAERPFPLILNSCIILFQEITDPSRPVINEVWLWTEYRVEPISS